MNTEKKFSEVNIVEILGSELGPLMRRAYESYHKVFDNIPDEKAAIIKAMIHCWKYADHAYDSATGRNGEDTDEKRIMSCGCFADMCIYQFNHLRSILNTSTDNLLRMMDNTSAWLKERDWHSLPSPVDARGVEHNKTAREMYDDMIRYSKVRVQLIEQIRSIHNADGSVTRRR